MKEFIGKNNSVIEFKNNVKMVRCESKKNHQSAYLRSVLRFPSAIWRTLVDWGAELYITVPILILFLLLS